jgi:hypothetical protein
MPSLAGANQTIWISQCASILIMPGVANTGCDRGIVPASEAAGIARGIGIGIETALLVEGNDSEDYVGTRMTDASMTSEGAIYFTRTIAAPGTCKSDVPLTVRGVNVAKLKSGTSNRSTWTGPTTDIVTTVMYKTVRLRPTSIEFRFARITSACHLTKVASPTRAAPQARIWCPRKRARKRTSPAPAVGSGSRPEVSSIELQQPYGSRRLNGNHCSD